jgi:hypothetical protein
MVRVSIDIVFFKNELLRMSVSVLRTIELEALQIFKALVDFGGVTRAAAPLCPGAGGLEPEIRRAPGC